MSPKHDYVFEITIDDEGNTQTLHAKKCPYSIFKAVRPLLVNDQEKALQILIQNLIIEDDREAAKRILDSDELIPIQGLEDAFAQILQPMEAVVKKNSSTAKLNTTKTVKEE